MSSLLRWSPVVAVGTAALSAGAALTGALPARWALALFLAVEAPLWLVSATLVVADVRSQRARGATTAGAVAALARQSPVWPLIRSELRLYRALLFWARRRHDVPSGAVAVTATAGTVAVPAAFLVASVIEAVVLHVVIPWQWLRITLLVLSVWSVVAVLGLLAISSTTPHYLTDTHLVLRHRGKVVASIARANVSAVNRRRRFSDTTPTLTGGRLVLPTPDGTTVDITTTTPTPAQLPTFRRARTAPVQVSTVSLGADNPLELQRLISPRQQPAS